MFSSLEYIMEFFTSSVLVFIASTAGIATLTISAIILLVLAQIFNLFYQNFFRC